MDPIEEQDGLRSIRTQTTTFMRAPGHIKRRIRHKERVSAIIGKLYTGHTDSSTSESLENRESILRLRKARNVRGGTTSLPTLNRNLS
jgi:hypothetical protein